MPLTNIQALRTALASRPKRVLNLAWALVGEHTCVHQTPHVLGRARPAAG